MCLQYTCVQCACISDVFGLYFGGLCIEDVNVCIMCRVYVRLCVWCTVCSVCTFVKCVQVNSTSSVCIKVNSILCVCV